MYLELFFLARQIIATLLQSSCVLTMYSKFLNKRIGYSPFFFRSEVDLSQGVFQMYI